MNHAEWLSIMKMHTCANMQSSFPALCHQLRTTHFLEAMVGVGEHDGNAIGM